MSIDRSIAAIEESILPIGDEAGQMFGVLTCPSEPRLRRPVGVVIVVGGPQTRVGSHRQFVSMARALARAGYPCLRFDYEGMGDTPGPKPDFESAGSDIRNACDALLAALADCRRIALWGLCDGATAAIFHATSDERVAAVIAANPWARSEATRSAAIVSDHYGSRLRSPEFWKKLATGKINVVATALEALNHVRRARAARLAGTSSSDGLQPPALSERLANALQRASADVRFQISGRDLTAAEFELGMKALASSGYDPTAALRLEQADHTFSDPQSWDEVIDDTKAVLDRL